MATQQLNQVPGEAEVWEVEGRHFLVWYVPNTDPPVPIAWFVSSSQDREALGIKKSNRKFKSWDDFYATGVLRQGNTTEILNTSEHPFEQLKSNWETEARVKPWLQDPEVVAVIAAAILEGREPTDAELKGTDWWREHTDTERKWLELNMADPATAQQLIEDNRIAVADLLRAAGVNNASDDLVNLIADNWTQGKWSEVYATKQVQLLADPFAEGAMDSELVAFRDGLDTTRAQEEDVRQMFEDWLGPAYTKFVGEDAISRWAGRLRNDPDSKLELEDFLRRQFRAHYNPDGKAYGDDATIRYSDVAPMWRSVFQQEWGQAPDETEDLFMDLIRVNDLTTARKMLRNEGLKRGVGEVANRLVSELGSVFGGNVRRADPSVM